MANFFKKSLFFCLIAALAGISLLMGGCGGGGGGGSRGATVVPVSSGVIPSGGSGGGTTSSRGRIKGKIYYSAARRATARVADPFLLKIPANTPQSLEAPDPGFSVATGTKVSAKIDGATTTTTTDASGTFEINNVPAGTIKLEAEISGKKVEIPVTVTAGKDNNQQSEVAPGANGNLAADTQLIHGDGTDGYKKETNADGTSDTVFVDGIRDHHEPTGLTQRDLTDDGIVDQQFQDPNDDGVPDGPVQNVGGGPLTQTSQSGNVNNTPPDIKSINSKDGKGKNATTVMAGESLSLSLDATDAEGGTTVKWSVQDAFGNDLTSQYLSNPDIVAPTFSPPQGDYSKPGAYIVTATLTDSAGLTSEKDIIIGVDTPGNKAPHASIKANHTAGEAPLTVDFTCDAFDNDGVIASYCWDMDKSNGINQSDCDDTRVQITKTFISAGKYRVTCIVTDDKGAVGFDMRVVVVRKKASPPTITTLTPSKTTVTPGESITITTAVSDDGSTPPTTTFIPSGGTMTDTDISDGKAVWTPPTAPGTYTIDVVATDSDGETTRQTLTITVEAPDNKAPALTISATPSSGDSPLQTTLTATASDPDGDQFTVTWDFDDSNGLQQDATGNTASVKYGGAGEYYVTAKACDSKGACTTAKTKVTATQPNRPPYATSVSASASSAEVGDPVQLDARAGDDDGDPLTYTWTATGGSLSSATSPSPVWTVPTTPGEYKASVTISDGINPPVTKETSVTVLPETSDKRPLPPEDCGVTSGNSVSLVTWTASPSSDVDHYKLSRTANGSETVLSSNIQRTAGSYSDTSLSNGTQYEYKLTAVDTDGFESDKCTSDMKTTPQPEVQPPVEVGENPGEGEYDESSDKFFVPIKDEDIVSVVDPGTGNVTKEIPVDDEPVYVCADPERKRVYVTCSGADILSVVDTATLEVIARIPVGDKPESCAVNTDNGDIYVGETGSDDVRIIDPITFQEKKRLQPGTDPVACSVETTHDMAIVTSGPDKKATFIDTNTLQVLKELSFTSPPSGCVDNDERGEVYFPLPEEGIVLPVEPPDFTVRPPINTGGSPECKCTINKKSNQIYITNKIKRTITLINGSTKQPEREITIQPAKGTCGADPARNKICVPNPGGGAISIIANPLPPTENDTVVPRSPDECATLSRNGSVDVVWATDYCENENPNSQDCIISAYKIRRSTSAAGPFTLIATASKSDYIITDSAVTNGTKYYYEISSVRPSGKESVYCTTDGTPDKEVSEVTPLPEPPPGETKKPCCTAHDEVRNIYYIANEENNTIDVINYDTHATETIYLPGGCCGDVAVDHVTNYIYVTNKTNNKLTVISGTDYTVVEEIEIPGIGGGKCEINETTNEIYITNELENEIIIYNPGQRKVVRVPIPSPGCPCDVTVNKITNEIFVTEKTTNKLTIINGTDYTVVEEIDLGGSGGPGTCVINEKTNTLYITNETTNEMVVYNRKANRVVKRINVGIKPVCKPCAVDTVTNHIFVTNEGSGTVSVIDGSSNTLAGTVNVGHDPNAVFIHGEDGVMVINAGDSTITKFSDPLLNTPSDTTAPAAPSGLMASSSSGGITLTWSANSESDLAYYSIYRRTTDDTSFGSPLTTTINNTYTDTSAAAGVGYVYSVTASDYAANESANSTTASGRTDLPSEISVGLYPAAIAVNETLNRVYVTNRDSNTMSIIDATTNTVTGTATTGTMPLGLDVDTTTGRVYVANFGGTAVSVFNGTTGALIKSVTTGGSAISAVAVDETSGMYYVTHANLGTPIVVPFTTAADTKGTSIITRPGTLGIGIMEPTDHTIVAANSLDGSVSVITPAGMTGLATPTITINSQPTDVVASSASLNKFAVSCGGTGKVAIIDNSTKAVTYVNVGLTPSGMGVDKTRNLAYVANSSSGTVSVIDLTQNRVIGEIYTGGDPTDVAVHSSLNKIFVTLKTAGKVVVRGGL